MVLGFDCEMNGAKMRSQTFLHITGTREFANSRVPVMWATLLFMAVMDVAEVLFHSGNLEDSWGILNGNLMGT